METPSPIARRRRLGVRWCLKLFGGRQEDRTPDLRIANAFLF
jgi:hypothetical protein